ncbi:MULTISPECIES: hypothetical protein [unclassified Sulfitobacter]|jgi:hypothetical protein|nr:MULTISPECIES: hypothetical protein [unclassified Sulfitobacter]
MAEHIVQHRFTWYWHRLAAPKRKKPAPAVAETGRSGLNFEMLNMGLS